MSAAIVLMTLLALLCGAMLGWAARRFAVEGNPLADAIDALLPQTQCAQCGFPGCRPYAEALARGGADLDLCPPGGAPLVKTLAEMLGRPLPDAAPPLPSPPALAFILEARCIGCALCLEACPVDAIVGAPRWMHTVVEAVCTGCALCLPPCPVDCIVLVDAVTRQPVAVP